MDPITDLELMQLISDTADRPLTWTHRAALELQRRRANDLTSYDRDNLRFAIDQLQGSMVARNSTHDTHCQLAILTLEMVLKRDATPIPRLTDQDKKALLWLQRNLNEVCGQKMSDTFHEEVCGALDKVLTYGQ